MLGSPGLSGEARRSGAKKKKEEAVFIDGDGESAPRGHGEGNERWELVCN